MAPARRGKPPRHPALHHPGSQPQLTQAPGSLEDIFAILLFFSPPLFWVLVATIRLSLVVAIRDYSLLWYTDSSSQQLSLLQSTGSVVFRLQWSQLPGG